MALIACTACANKNVSNDKPIIYVTIQPLKYIIEEIVGDDFDIEVLVPAGASPETFEPTPRQFIALNESQMVFSVGLIDFERNLTSKIKNHNKLVDLSQGIELIAGTCSHNHHDLRNNDQATGIDPHIWSSPRSLKVMADNAFEAMNRECPDSVKYVDNYKQLIGKIDSLDIEVRKLCENTDKRYFIIYHPALTYFARDYGIEQVSIEDEGKEPSARRLAGIISKARQDGIRRVFYQAQFPRSTVEIIAEDMGAEAVEIDPLAEDVIDNIGKMIRLITE